MLSLQYTLSSRRQKCYLHLHYFRRLSFLPSAHRSFCRLRVQHHYLASCSMLANWMAWRFIQTCLMESLSLCLQPKHRWESHFLPKFLSKAWTSMMPQHLLFQTVRICKHWRVDSITPARISSCQTLAKELFLHLNCQTVSSVSAFDKNNSSSIPSPKLPLLLYLC